LGKGSFGETYLAVFKGKEVALKCVRMVGDSGAQLFLRELEALTRVQNPNVMAFFGRSPHHFMVHHAGHLHCLSKMQPDDRKITDSPAMILLG
jgi:serine/threonine protein kinase